MGVAASIGGALIQGSAARKAAKAQERAAERDIAFQTETRDLIRNDLSTYRTGGTLAQQALDYELGLADRPVFGGSPLAIETVTTGGTAGGGQTALSGGAAVSRLMDSFGRSDRDGTGAANGAGAVGGIDSRQSTAAGTAGTTMYRVGGQTFSTLAEAQAYANANATGGREYGGYTKTPGYDFRLKQGEDSLQAGAAARGGLYSGAAMRDLLKFGQDYGSAEYGNYLSRLGARADTGMSAAAMSGQASQAAAGNISNAFGDMGNAQSAGYIGMGNAFSSGIDNALGAWNYQKNMSGSGGGGYGGGR